MRTDDLKRILVIALLVGLSGLMAACEGVGDPELGRLHAAQREYWEARRYQERLDIYPNRTLAEECRDRYLDIAARFSLAEVPQPTEDPESTPVKLARVGAMAALGAAGLQRELGESDAAIALLQTELRPDLPLGALVERKLRGSLASNLRDDGRPGEAIAVYRSLLEPLRADLEEEHAAYPDEQLLMLPGAMVRLAESMGDSAILAGTGEFLAGFFAGLETEFGGSDAEYAGLLTWSELAMSLGRWDEAEAALLDLADHFPDRDPWRSDIQRARLLAERLGREEEAEEILSRWAESGRGRAAVVAGKERIRFLLNRDRHEEIEPELTRLKRAARRREDRAELLYLWGVFESRRGAWDQARLRWGEAAVDAPFAPFGMESQLAVALIWAEREQPRFSARALDRLFRACRRNTRHYPGSELASLSLALETRGDSLLGTLPASDEAVQELHDRRRPAREGSR